MLSVFMTTLPRPRLPHEDDKAKNSKGIHIKGANFRISKGKSNEKVLHKAIFFVKTNLKQR